MIGTEDNLRVLRQLIDNLLRIRRRHHYIRQRLHFSRRVHVRNDHMIGMLRLKRCQVLCFATIGQRTTGIRIRNQHFLIRTEDLHRLTHEMHTAHYQYIRIHARSLLCKR